ncbi:B-box zinc finger protein 22 [Camellia lanceoleosa]|uniref:B-box zinc finger protein 22 n=1 Tax=Camellia lanceoleosa TaxID=1840588 RepID=A0ACC0H6J3_9ERIC|nr:B-box zinc finger protein 22 [Camellia lanceoleosa]
MKIQCNVCGVAEAKVLCCADEAALCWACDEKVHAANKLASKHQRISLSSSSSPMPKCDICQEMVGYFFCLEDRALFCRKCDVSIHTANTHVSAHQRFLLMGVKVELESSEPGASSSSGNSNSGEKISETESRFLSKKGTPMSLSGQCNKVLPVQVSGVGDFAPTKFPLAGGSAAASIPQWHSDEFVRLTELNQTYGYMDNSSSKADTRKLGDSDCSAILSAGEEELDASECLGQVPEASWTVPQVPNSSTLSGLDWPKNNQSLCDTAVFVPDIMQNASRYQPSCPSSKRQREF